ncbi:MAG: hypothetical protein ACRER5_10920, partial [Pseudomonas sp.]
MLLRLRQWALGVLLTGLCGLYPAWADDTANTAREAAQAAPAEGYVAAATCLGCHTAEAAQWKDSDHGWAMRDATGANVLGNFK